MEIANIDADQTEQTRRVVTDLFAALAEGNSPQELAARYAEDVDWRIPGDTDNVPWIGRKHGRAGVAEFFGQLGALAVTERFTLRAIIAEGQHGVVLGDLVTLVRSTGQRIESEFAYDIEVQDGLITRYHMYEDSWAVSVAARPATG